MSEALERIEALRIELAKLEADYNKARLIAWARKSLFGH
jgi:uncharacterized small protein (DUF1192 family)